MEKFVFCIGKLRIQICSESLILAEQIKCGLLSTIETENVERYDYTILFTSNIGLKTIAMTCISSDGIIVYRDSVLEEDCVTLLFNQLLPMLITKSTDYLIFHASSCIINNKLFLFMGKSGSGKTTLLLKILLRHNGVYFSDDFTLYDWQNDVFIPYVGMFHVKSEAEKHLLLSGNDKKVYYKISDDRSKVAYKIYFPADFSPPLNTLRKTIGSEKIIVVDTKYLEHANDSERDGLFEIPSEMHFDTLVRNCTNIKTRSFQLLKAYTHIKEKTIYLRATFQDDREIINSLINM